jgi:rubrerythrin
MGIIEILEGAIEGERNAREKYLKLAGDANDPETRAILEQLAQDEEGHVAVLRKRLAAIKLMQDLGGV